MELIDGVPITDLVLYCNTVPENVASYILRQVLTATTFLHEKGVIHRDLKVSELHPAPLPLLRYSLTSPFPIYP